MTRYKVTQDYSVPNSTVTLSKDEIVDTTSTGLTGVQLQALYGLGILTEAESSSKVRLKYNPNLNYLQGDSVSNYGSVWSAKVDVPKNKTYVDQTAWEVDWEIDVQGVI